MDKLKKNSIFIPGTIVTCWPRYGGSEKSIDMSNIATEFDGCYAIKNSTICYVIDGEVFITPYTKEAIASISGAGLIKKDFLVPCGDGDYPKQEGARWTELREQAIHSCGKEFEKECTSWCDQHGIRSLSKETLKNCFKLPISGVPVRHAYFKTTYFPVLNGTFFDGDTTGILGHYSSNGNVAFVYRDGHTYVTKGSRFLSELRQAGFKEAKFFVPFCSGEAITDPELAKKWNKIQK